MRVDVEPVSPLLNLLRKHRPCPQCGSERVTARKEGDALRVACSDCGYSREAKAPDAPHEAKT
jgi:ribosomal protein S27AE